jgi:hypothetical protein
LGGFFKNASGHPVAAICCLRAFNQEMKYKLVARIQKIEKYQKSFEKCSKMFEKSFKSSKKSGKIEKIGKMFEKNMLSAKLKMFKRCSRVLFKKSKRYFKANFKIF